MAVRRITFSNPPSSNQVRTDSKSKSTSKSNLSNKKWKVQPLDSSGKPIERPAEWSPTFGEKDYEEIRRHHLAILRAKHASNQNQTRSNRDALPTPSKRFPRHIEPQECCNFTVKSKGLGKSRPKKRNESDGFLVAETQDDRQTSSQIDSYSPANPSHILNPERGASLPERDSDRGSSSSNQRVRERNEKLKVIDLDSDSDADSNHTDDNDGRHYQKKDEASRLDEVVIRETPIGILNQDSDDEEEEEDEEDEMDQGMIMQSQESSNEVGRNNEAKVGRDSLSRSNFQGSQSMNFSRREDSNPNEARSLSTDIQVSSWSKGFGMGVDVSIEREDDDELSIIPDSQGGEEEMEDETQDEGRYQDDTIDRIAQMEMDEALRPHQSANDLGESRGDLTGNGECSHSEFNPSDDRNRSRFNLTLAPPTPSSRDGKPSDPEFRHETSGSHSEVEIEKKKLLNPNLMKPFKSHALQNRPPPRLGMVSSRESKRQKIEPCPTDKLQESNQSLSTSKPSISKNDTTLKSQVRDSNSLQSAAAGSYNRRSPNFSIQHLQDSISLSIARAEKPSHASGEDSIKENNSHSESMLIKAPKPAFKQPQVTRALTTNNERGRMEKALRDRERLGSHSIDKGKKRLIEDDQSNINEKDYTEVEQEERELSYNLSFRDENQKSNSISKFQSNSIQTFFESQSQTQSFLSDTNLLISIPPPLNFDLQKLTSISTILSKAKDLSDIDRGELVNVLVLVTEISGLNVTFNNESYFGELKVMDQSAPPISLKSWGRIAEDWNGGEEDEEDGGEEEGNYNDNKKQLQHGKSETDLKATNETQYLPTQTPNHTFKSLRKGDVVYLSNLKVRQVNSKPVPQKFLNKARKEARGMAMGEGKIVELVASERSFSKAHICWREAKWEGDKFLTFDQVHCEFNPKYKKVMELAKMMDFLK